MEDVERGRGEAEDGGPAHAAEHLVHESPSVVGLEPLVPNEAEEEQDVHDGDGGAGDDAVVKTMKHFCCIQ